MKPQQDNEGEEDEVNRDKNRKINKIAVEIAMIKEKMEKMQQVFHKALGMDDFLYIDRPRMYWPFGLINQLISQVN